METARAMFEKYNKLRETAKAMNTMAAFKTKWTEYKTDEDIMMMTDVLQDRENGRVITCLSFM
eukprot:923632-Rhodomonas_salina.1